MIDIKNIKKTLSQNYDLNKIWWIVISWFKWEKQLQNCKWIIFSAKKIEQNLEEIYNKHFKDDKNISFLVIDIIWNTQDIKSTNEIKNIDLVKEWIFLWDTQNDNWSFILPNTHGVSSIKKALQTLRKQTEFSSKQINMFKFTTQRFTIH